MNYLSIVAGLLFGGWPLVMKKSGLSPMGSAITLTVASLVVYLPFMQKTDRPSGFLTIGFGLALTAGIMNGVGTIAFTKMLVTDNISIVVGVLLVILTQVVVTSLGGWAFHGDIFTTKKVAGLLTAAIAAYLLTSK